MNRGRLLTRAVSLMIGIGLFLGGCAGYAYDGYVGDPPYGSAGFDYGGWGGWHHGWDHGHWDGHESHLGLAPGHWGHGIGGHGGFGGHGAPRLV